MRKMFGPKGDEVTGGWTDLHIGFHSLCSSRNIIKIIK
jgi:hypothetical protein